MYSILFYFPSSSIPVSWRVFLFVCFLATGFWVLFSTRLSVSPWLDPERFLKMRMVLDFALASVFLP